MSLSKLIKISSLSLVLGICSAQSFAQQETEGLITGDFYFESLYGNRILASRVITGALFDDDLIRGNSDSEVVNDLEQIEDGDSSPFPYFRNGIAETEQLITIVFNDNSSIENVQSVVRSAILNYGRVARSYLIDPTALASAGKSLNDISDIIRGAQVNHGLSWADFGFSSSDGSVVAEVDPIPELPDFNLIIGDEGNDRLVGTDDRDVMDGRGGVVDRLTGGLGNDSFVAGGDASNGVRNYDLVLDFNTSEDSLILESGATVDRVVSVNGYLVLILTGADQDIVGLRAVDTGIESVDIDYLDVLLENSSEF